MLPSRPSTHRTLSHVVKLKLYTHLTITPHSSCLPDPGNCHPTCCPMNPTIPDTSNEGNHILFHFFGDWLILFSVMSSRFIHVVACVRISFPVKAESYSFACPYHVVCTHTSVDGRLGCFHLLILANNAAKNMGARVSLVSAFSSFGNMSISGISGSHDSSIFNLEKPLWGRGKIPLSLLWFFSTGQIIKPKEAD